MSDRADKKAGPNPFLDFGEALLRAPEAAVADALSGRNPLGTQQRAEPEDLFADLLAHPHWQEQRAVLTERIDHALLAWFADHAAWPLQRITGYGTRAYVAEFSDALAIAARLTLPLTARELIENHAAWENRLGGIRWPGEMDLLRQLDLVLIQHQTDTRFAPRWFAACDRAAWGGPHWRTDLATGLLGLRKLPHPPKSQPEKQVAAALARFAALAPKRGLAEYKVQMAFQRGAASLQALYPRRDEHWHVLWHEVMENLAESQRRAVYVIKKRWLPAVLPGGANVSASHQKGASRRSKKSGFADLPAREEREALLTMLKRGRLDAGLWNKVRDLMRRQFAFADSSGDSYFAVRTLHNLGHRLLRLGVHGGQLRELHAWSLRAVELEPGSPFPWGLWARVLTAMGHTDSALAVRWETIRRFPKNPVSRTELAEELRHLGKLPVAEHLLRETLRDFPRDEVCRVALAELLRETGRLDDAEVLLHETMRDFPRDEVTRNVLAELLRETGRVDDAEALLRATMRDFPGDKVCRGSLAELLRKSGRVDDAETLLRETIRDFPRDRVCRNILAELLLATKRVEEAESLLRETMKEFPRNAVCRVSLAELLRKTGRVDDAEAVLRATMRDFPRDKVCRVVLAMLLWRQGRGPESEAALAEAERLASKSDPYIEAANKLIRNDETLSDESIDEHVLPMRFYLDARSQADEEDASWSETRSPDVEESPEPAKSDTPDIPDTHRADESPTGSTPEATTEPVSAEHTGAKPGDGAKTRPAEPVSEPVHAVDKFLENLRGQVPLIQGYFAGANGSNDALQAEFQGGILSDLALVIASRAHVFDEAQMREQIEGVNRVRPASFSARLLQAWKGSAEDPLDLDALEAIGRDFPEHRVWTNWLRLPALDKAKRSSLISELLSSRNEHERSLWDGRLEAVYPQLEPEADSVAVDFEALGRLLEDVALAQAAPAVPSVALH